MKTLICVVSGLVVLALFVVWFVPVMVATAWCYQEEHEPDTYNTLE